MSESTPAQAPTPAEIAAAMRLGYAQLIDVASTPEFQSLLDDLYRLPPTSRPAFVNDIVLNPDELDRRNICLPEGVLIQRSAFGDRRPTLFCIKKFLPTALQSHWQNVNLTFDNIFGDEEVPRDQRAWRPPLPIDLQQAVIAGLVDGGELP